MNKKILVFLVVALILATIHLAEAQQPKSKIQNGDAGGQGNQVTIVSAKGRLTPILAGVRERERGHG